MSSYRYRPATIRFMADLMPGGSHEFDFGESLIACRVTEIKRSKPEMLIFVGEDASEAMDFTYFKNGVDFYVDVGDFLKCKARFKPSYRNFTASLITKIDEEEAEICALECRESREREAQMRAANLPPDLGGSYVISDMYTNAERKPTGNRDEIEQKIFETLFFDWLEWASSHADAQPRLRFNELMDSVDLRRLVEESADEETVRTVLQEVLEGFERTGIFKVINKSPEIDLSFFRTFTDRFLDRLHEIGCIELEGSSVFREFNVFIPGNTKRLVSFSRFQGYMKELFENRLLDFPNDPRHYRLKER